MAASQKELGIVGLGRMGGGLALRALELGYRVFGLTRSGASAELKRSGIVDLDTLAQFWQMARPRCVQLYVPAGAAVDDLLAELSPILEHGDVIADGYAHVGPPGSGHFVKLVHNEFGMLQAIGEGFELLTRHHQDIDISSTLECWRHGAVIRSWLIDLLAEAYKRDPELTQPSSFVEDTGEVNWLLSDALRMEAPIPVIAQSVMQLLSSRDTRANWARAIVLMRHGFGSHPFGPDEDVARERREGRVGEIFEP